MFRASAGAWGWHPEDADLPRACGRCSCPRASFPGCEGGMQHVPHQEPWAAMLWGAVGGLGCCHFHAKHQEAPPPPGAVGMGGLCWRAAAVIWRAGSQCGDGQPGSRLPGCQYPASCPLFSDHPGGFRGSSRPLPGGLCSLAARLRFSEPRRSLLGARARFRMCLPAAADICLLSVSRNGKPFRGSLASFVGFMFSFLVLTTGRDGSWCSTNPARAGLPSQPAPGFLK